MYKKHYFLTFLTLVAWELYAFVGVIKNYKNYAFFDYVVVYMLIAIPIMLFALKVIKNIKRAKDPTTTIANCAIEHIEGLDLAQGTRGNICLSKEKTTLKFSGHNYNIDNNKILIFDVKTDVEIQHIAEQSGTGMIIGALIFGHIGAMVGGRVKNNEKKCYTYFILLNYKSNEEVKYITMKVIDKVDFARNIRSKFMQLGIPQENLCIDL